MIFLLVRSLSSQCKVSINEVFWFCVFVEIESGFSQVQRLESKSFSTLYEIFLKSQSSLLYVLSKTFKTKTSKDPPKWQ